MPAIFHMTWEPKRRMWRKLYRGVPYTQSCRQLSAWTGQQVPGTKDGSYRFANAWWEAKKKEIDAQPVPDSTPTFLTERLKYAEGHALPLDARYIKGEIDRLKAGGKPTSVGPNHIVPEIDLTPEDDISVLMRALYKHDPVWKDRLELDATQPTAQSRTIQENIDKYLENRRVKTESEYKSVANYDEVKRCLLRFCEWAGPSNDVEVLNADRFDDWYNHLVKLELSNDYKKKILAYSRRFVHWIARKGLVPLPGNIQDPDHRFRVGAKDIPLMTIGEVRDLIDNADGQHRLHFLLMANCGYTQADIGKLKHDEIDWVDGRITRKRTKTSKHENVPTISYKLWDVTFRLLKEFRSGHPTFALTTPGGGPLWIDELRGGKRYKYDSIKWYYEKYIPRLNKSGKGPVDKPLKLMRKTSSTLLDHEDRFARYADAFLGHAPNTIGDVHYKGFNHAGFDRAIHWLGQQYRYEES